LAPFGATQLNLGIVEHMSAPRAAPPGVVLEELNFRSALGAFRHKDVVGLPKTGILTGAFHLFHGNLIFP
jgi:hypothetical protein